MKLDSVTLEEALELFKLPRHLGETKDGKAISTNVGRFGPYVKYGDQFASLKKDDDPYTITLERALELIAEKQVKDAEKVLRDFGNGIQILKGRWGSYLNQVVKRSKIQVRLPKDREPDSMTLEECQALLAPPLRPKRKARKKGGRSSQAGSRPGRGSQVAKASSQGCTEKGGGSQRQPAAPKKATTRKNRHDAQEAIRTVQQAASSPTLPRRYGLL